MQMILNELSANFPVSTREEGKLVMANFLEVCQEVRKILLNDSMILDKDYNVFYLAKNYHISEWRKDPTVDREQQRLFRSILNKAVVYDGREIDDVHIDVSDSEFTYDEKSAIGCLIAYETNNFVVSFKTHKCWEKTFIKGLYSTLLEEETIESPKEVQVFNICKTKDIDGLKENYHEQINQKFQNIRSGRDLVEHLTEWFPAIQFCDRAIEQLSKENYLINLQQIIKKLLELNQYFSDVKGSFDMSALKHCTPESEATLKHYKQEHTFLTPDGREELFSFHLRYTGTYAGRIFFKPDVGNQRCIVAHIGKKLKNQTYH
ncbi:MAG TPA: hypothetical protein DCW90_12275 [Lachnospiraceae bacterium]|nr:hypothetical protein [uncultured Lachnoclostridium sp.]HAU86230.1 hypothetical protein [Lachnospiraceae bacterium]